MFKSASVYYFNTFLSLCVFSLVRGAPALGSVFRSVHKIKVSEDGYESEHGKDGSGQGLALLFASLVGKLQLWNHYG